VATVSVFPVSRLDAQPSLVFEAEQWLNRSMTRLVGLVLAATAVAAVAGCGGSGTSSSGSSDPATQSLNAAGLEVCSEGTRDLPPTITSMPGLAVTRVFDVAKNCNGAKQTPNAIAAFQFTSKESFTSGTKTIKAALPKAAAHATYPIVIAAIGPDREANLAAVEQHLPPGLAPSS
jgi:hypothetical protein